MPRTDAERDVLAAALRTVREEHGALWAQYDSLGQYGTTPADAILAAMPDHAIVRRPREGTRLVEVADDLLETLGTRDASGRALSFEWGEPDGGVYTPVVTATDDGMVLMERAEVERLRAVVDAGVDVDYAVGRALGNTDDPSLVALRVALRAALGGSDAKD